MPVEPTIDCLPLIFHTPGSWGVHALSDPIALLNDHAHLEQKACNNALNLLNQYPDRDPPEHWVQVMCAVALDEAQHLQQVVRLLHQRGGEYTKAHNNPYAKALRGLIRAGQGPRAILDRLLVSSLIELRSCERFAILADSLERMPDEAVGDRQELFDLYAELWASEHGHYKVFLKLAKELPGTSFEEVDARWQWMRDQEAVIIESLPVGIGMHTGT